MVNFGCYKNIDNFHDDYINSICEVIFVLEASKLTSARLCTSLPTYLISPNFESIHKEKIVNDIASASISECLFVTDVMHGLGKSSVQCNIAIFFK